MNLLRIPFQYVALFSASLLLASSPVFAQDKKEDPKKPATISKKTPAPKTAAKPKVVAKSKAAVKETPTAKDEKAPEKKEVTPIVKKDTPATVKTHTVKAEAFEVIQELSGIVGAVESTRISLSPKAWSDLSVVKAAKHGTAVKKGDVILQLDTEKLKKSINEKKDALPLAELSLKVAERDLANTEKTNPMDLAYGRMKKMQEEENLAYFEDVDMPMQIRSAKEAVKSSKNYLAYAEEELNQLKKMYENDDVTEETEEIILLRAQNSVDNYKWSLERAETRMKRSLDTSIPRDHGVRKRNMQREQIKWRSSEQSIPEQLDKKRLETEQARRTYKKTIEDLSDLEKDLAMMTVRAPHDGIVYLGMSQRGKWTTASTVERKLIPGGKLTPKEIVMTVTSPKQLQLHVAVPENKLKDISEGQKGTTTLKWNSDIKLETQVASVSYVPTSSNTYVTLLNLKGGKDKSPIFPGMNATAKVKVYENAKALLVPNAAIKTEDDKSFVSLKGGKKREVKKGRANKTSTEILSGLKAGDVVEVPKTTATAAKPTIKKATTTKK